VDLSTNYNNFVSNDFIDLSTNFNDLSTDYNNFIATDFTNLSNAVDTIESGGVTGFSDLSDFTYNALGSNDDLNINIVTTTVSGGALSNIFIGHGDTGTGVTTGKSNIFIGSSIGTDENTYSNQSNIMILGKYSSTSRVPILANLSTGKLGIGLTDTDFTPSYELTVSGDVSAGIMYATEFRAESDRTLKTNIRKIDDSYNIISRLEPIYFNWKNKNKGSNTEMGFIAQDVEGVFPSLVGTSSNGIKTLAYQKLVSVLTAELKEQHKRMLNMEERISSLESRLTEK
jgi:hypothetical protein